MKTRTIEHPSFTRLLNRIVEECPVHSSGTYNRADPTCFEKGKMQFEYKDNAYLFEFFDCTWGIEVTISKMVLRALDLDVFEDGNIPDWAYTPKELAGFYINRDRRYNEKTKRYENIENVILRQKSLKGMPGLLARAFRKCLAFDFIGARVRYEMEMARQEFCGSPVEYY